MIIYIVYIPQINTYGDLHEDDLPVSWHSTEEGAYTIMEEQQIKLLNDHAETQITGREEESIVEIITEHCYVLMSELSY